MYGRPRRSNKLPSDDIDANTAENRRRVAIEAFRAPDDEASDGPLLQPEAPEETSDDAIHKLRRRKRGKKVSGKSQDSEEDGSDYEPNIGRGRPTKTNPKGKSTRATRATDLRDSRQDTKAPGSVPRESSMITMKVKPTMSGITEEQDEQLTHRMRDMACIGVASVMGDYLELTARSTQALKFAFLFMNPEQLHEADNTMKANTYSGRLRHIFQEMDRDQANRLRDAKDVLAVSDTAPGRPGRTIGKIETSKDLTANDAGLSKVAIPEQGEDRAITIEDFKNPTGKWIYVPHRRTLGYMEKVPSNTIFVQRYRFTYGGSHEEFRVLGTEDPVGKSPYWVDRVAFDLYKDTWEAALLGWQAFCQQQELDIDGSGGEADDVQGADGTDDNEREGEGNENE